MIVGILVFVAFIAGFALASWALDAHPLPSAHEMCDERYMRMQQRLRGEIEIRDREIARLLEPQP